jgi:elongation factor P
MAKITGNEISPGTLINYDGGLWIAVKTQKVKPGKGGAYNQVELKNVVSRTKLNQRFRSDESVDEAGLDQKDFQFLFASGDMLTFMDMETYDQIELATDFVGEQAQFLQDGMKTLVQLYDGKPIGIKLPGQVTLIVTEADPVLKGGTAAPSYKSAVLENGMKIQVPPFIAAGERIVVATEDGSYVRRAE